MRSTLIICVFLAGLSYDLAAWINADGPVTIAREQQAFIREMTGHPAAAGPTHKEKL
jgi:hypothetical protein